MEGVKGTAKSSLPQFMSTNINVEPVRSSVKGVSVDFVVWDASVDWVMVLWGCFSGFCGYRCFKGLSGMVWRLGVFQWTGGYRCFSRPVATGVSRDWVVWCFGGVSVVRWLQVFQGTGWYGVLGVFQWTGGYRCFKGGMVWCFGGV